MKNHVYILVAIVTLVSAQTIDAGNPSLITRELCNGDLVTGVIDDTCAGEFIAHVIKQLFMLTGALSLLMIMVGGFEYTLDKIVGGKEKGVKRIKNGILGLVLSGLAFFIVQFVIQAITKQP